LTAIRAGTARAGPEPTRRGTHAVERRAAEHPRLPELPGRGRVPRGIPGHRVPELPLPLSGARRHPHHAGRRGREAVTPERVGVFAPASWPGPESPAGAMPPAVDLDDPAALAALDPGGMLGQVASGGDQARAALAAAQAAPLNGPAPHSVVVAGMGGS